MARAKKPKALIRLMSRNTRRGKKNSALSSLSNTPFMAKGSLHAGIYVRTGKARLPIKALFSFVPQAKIKRALHFEPGAEAKAISVYPKHMRQELARAIAFARLK